MASLNSDNRATLVGTFVDIFVFRGTTALFDRPQLTYLLGDAMDNSIPVEQDMTTLDMCRSHRDLIFNRAL